MFCRFSIFNFHSHKSVILFFRSFCCCYFFFVLFLKSCSMYFRCVFKHGNNFFILKKSYKNFAKTWFNIDISIACGKKLRFFISVDRIIFHFQRTSGKHLRCIQPFRCLCSQSIELKFQSKKFSLEELKSINVLLFTEFLFLSLLVFPRNSAFLIPFFMFADVPLLCDVTTSFQNHNWIVYTRDDERVGMRRRQSERVQKPSDEEEISFFTFIQVKKNPCLSKALLYFALHISKHCRFRGERERENTQ